MWAVSHSCRDDSQQVHYGEDLIKEAICMPEGSQLSPSFIDLAAIFVHQSSQNTSVHMQLDLIKHIMVPSISVRSPQAIFFITMVCTITKIKLPSNCGAYMGALNFGLTVLNRQQKASYQLQLLVCECSTPLYKSPFIISECL